MSTRTLNHAGLGAAALAALSPMALPAAAAAATTKTYKGKLEQTFYSNVQVTISVRGRRITSLAVNANPQDQQSYQREAYALPILRHEALKSQTYRIHTVSGVTTTSEAFILSLYSAMHHASLV